MPDFGDTIFEGALTPEVAQQSPVVDNSGAVFAESLGGAFQAAGQVFGGIVKNKINADQTAVFDDYRLKMAKIARGVQQGSINSREANMLVNELYTSTISNNPGSGEEISKIHNQMIGASGIANVVTEGNPQEQLNRKIYESAATAGWINPNGSMEEQDQQLQSYIRAQQLSNQVKIEQDRLNMLQATNGIVTEQDKFKANQLIKEISAEGMTWATNRINQAVSDVKKGGDPASTLTALRTEINGQLANVGILSQGGDIKWIEDSYGRLLKVAEDLILGTTTQEVADAEIKRISSNQKLAILADPKRARLVAASELLGAGPVIEGLMNQQAINMFADLTSPEVDPTTGERTKSPDLIGTTSDIRVTIDAAVKGIESRIKNGTLEGPALEEAITIYVNMLRNGKEHAASSAGATDFVPLVNAMASDAIGEVAVKAGGISTDLVTTMDEAISSFYTDTLLPLVREQLNSDPEISIYPSATNLPSHMQSPLALGAEQTEVSTSKAIEMIWNGAGVEFIAAPGFTNDPTIRARVTALNTGSSSVAGPLNNLIRANAHILGSKDYEKIWNEKIMPKVFPEMVNTGQEGSSGTTPADTTTNPSPASTMGAIDPLAQVSPQNLTIEDFNLQALTAQIQNSEAANPRKMLNAKNPLEAASAFLGLRESNSEEAKVLSAFFKESVGINLNPAKTAWCAAFVDSVLRATGATGTGQLNARSYLNWGVPVDKPKAGDVVVFSRGDPNGWQGHVGFYVGTNPDGTIKVLGGNQSDSVGISDYDASKLLGFRRAS